ncbi:hypothetical protein Tco_0115261 [Tanacetum coccineum]
MFSLIWIMPPRVMTQSAGRPAVESLLEGESGTVKRERVGVVSSSLVNPLELAMIEKYVYGLALQTVEIGSGSNGAKRLCRMQCRFSG